jgi:hypothetical protein
MKRKIEIVQTIHAKVEYDAQGWELFSSMEGSEKVAQALNVRLNELLMEHHIVSDDNAYAVYEEMGKLMWQYKEYGASDTEPRGHLRHILRTIYGEDSI